MWLHEAAGKEEGLVLDLPHDADHFVADLAVAEIAVSAVGILPGGAADAGAGRGELEGEARLGIALEDAFPLLQQAGLGHLLPLLREFLECLRLQVAGCLGVPGRCAPGRGIVESAVVDLAEAPGEVAVVPEMLGEGHRVGEDAPEMGLEVVDAGGLGAEAREQRCPRRSADGLLAVGPFEERALGGEAVDVRGEHPLAPIATELGTEVVGRDEEDVARLAGGGRPRRGVRRPRQSSAGLRHGGSRVASCAWLVLGWQWVRGGHGCVPLLWRGCAWKSTSR